MNVTVVDGLELKEADAEKVRKTVIPANDPLQKSSDLNDQMSKNMKDEIKIPSSSQCNILGFELKQNQDQEGALPDDTMIIKPCTFDNTDVQDIPTTKVSQ